MCRGGRHADSDSSSLLGHPLQGSEARRINERVKEKEKEGTEQRDFPPLVLLWAEFENHREREVGRERRKEKRLHRLKLKIKTKEKTKLCLVCPSL